MRVVKPSNDIYAAPRDYPAQCMHYAVVQVSDHRYVVAEYRHGTQPVGAGCPIFEVVSNPMRYMDAEELALKLTRERAKK